MNQELATTNGTYSLSTNKVRLLTENTGDEMTSEDYYELYLKLRGNRSLSQFAKDMGEYPSKMEWWRYDNRVAERDCIFDALRKASGMLETHEVIQQHVPKGTPVFFLGEGDEAGAVLLVGDTTAGYNGPGGIRGYLATAEVPSVESTPVLRAQRRYYRPCLSGELKDLIEDSGESVEELLRYALEMKRREL
jgi:hypothetical protein